MDLIDAVNRFFASVEGFSSFVFSTSILAIAVLLLFALAALLPFLAAGNAVGIVRFGAQYFTSSYRRLPERKRTWGTVFDAVTLQPVSFIKVELLGHDRRVLETRVTDAQGRYGFLATPSSLIAHEVEVFLSVASPNHTFPVVTVNDAHRLVYGSLYTGQPLTVHPDMLIAFDIPVEPLDRKKVSPKKAPSIWAGIASAAMADAGLWIGAVSIPLAFLLVPNPFTLGFLFLFLGTASLRLFGIARRPYGTVVDATSTAVPFALITVHDTNNVRVAFVVTDERGRYVISLARGTYRIHVQTPANVSPPRTTRADLTTSSGWVTERFIL